MEASTRALNVVDPCRVRTYNVVRRLRRSRHRRGGERRKHRAQGVNFVDLCEQPSPGRTGLLDGHGLIGRVLLGWAEAQSWLRLVVLLPALGSQAEQMGLAEPCTTRSRGVLTVAANQPGLRIRKVLHDFDEKLC
jgi:hypothetical protein